MSTIELKAIAFFSKQEGYTRRLYQTFKINISVANTEHDLSI